MLDAIVFDFDGVVVDSEPLHYRAFIEVLRPRGVTFTYAQYLERYIGFDDREVFAAALQANGSAAGQAPDQASGAEEHAARLRGLILAKEAAFARLIDAGEIQPVPGSLELIDEAAAAMPIAIATGATTADIEHMLRALDRRDRFSAIVTADDVARSKPDPQTYADAVQRLAHAKPERAISAGNCLAIEDTAAGIAAAREAGLQTLALTTTCPRDQLHQAHRVIDTLAAVNLRTLHDWFG